MYDYLVVGAGFFGAVFAYNATSNGKRVVVIDKREHIGGNAYTEKIENITVHKYGPHIFHTSNKRVWEFVNKFSDFNHFTNSPLANYNGEIYNLPFNMNTFNSMWGVTTPQQARDIIQKQVKASGIKDPKNLEEYAIASVGFDIYNKLIKGYTEKQWGRDARSLPCSIIKRLPLRFTYDNNYFEDRYQGIPENGYTPIFEKLLADSHVWLGVDFLKERDTLQNLAKRIVYSGAIDEYYGYQFGILAYRNLKFETRVLDEDNFQGNAVVNYTDGSTPYTRIIEHKHFEFANKEKTVITHEFPAEWKQGEEPFYPLNDEDNDKKYQKYHRYSKRDKKTIFGGRLGAYKYYNMDEVIHQALILSDIEFEEGE